MASSPDLVKYYSTLSQSFDKVQDRASKSTLVNAAFRPKISEDCVKSNDLFDNYINYIKLFCVIYPDQFKPLCSSVLLPMLSNCNRNRLEEFSKTIHDAFISILESHSYLANDLASSVEKILIDDQDTKAEVYKSKHINKSFLSSVLLIAQHLDGLSLVSVIQALFNTLTYHELLNSQESTPEPLDYYANLICQFIDSLKSDEEKLDRMCLAFIEAFTSNDSIDFKATYQNNIIFYVSSLKESYNQSLIHNLWEIFLNPNYNSKHRKSCIIFIGSFVARADFVDIDRIMTLLAAASRHYKLILQQYQAPNCDRNFNEDKDLICALSETIFYIIGQRYKEMYLDEISRQLFELDLEDLIVSIFNPLSNCCQLTCKRFKEVAFILGIIDNETCIPDSKDLPPALEDWSKPFPEDPSKAKVREKNTKIMRPYVGHSLFTIVR